MALQSATFNSLDKYKKPVGLVPGGGGKISDGPDDAVIPPNYGTGPNLGGMGGVISGGISNKPSGDYFTKFRNSMDDLTARSRAFENERTNAVAPTINIGYTDAEKRGMKLATSAPISASFRTAGEQMRNNALVTGSNTGLAPAMTRLAQERGMTIAPALAGLEGTFGNARREDEKSNADIGLRFQAQRSADILGAQGQQAGYAGQEAGVASTELNRDTTVSENEKNRFLTADQNQRARELQLLGMQMGQNQANAALKNSKPSLLNSALTGGIGALTQYLGGAGGKGGTVDKVGGAAGGLGRILGSWGPTWSTNGTTVTSTTGGTGLLGGVHAGLKGIGGAIGSIPLAGQIALGVAGGVLLGKKVFGIGNTHEKATDWVSHEQNQFDQYMNEINQAEKSGQIQPDQAQQARQETVSQYMDAARSFKGQGKDQTKVIQQAMDTFKKWYGDPSQYGAQFA